MPSCTKGIDTFINCESVYNLLFRLTHSTNAGQKENRSQLCLVYSISIFDRRKRFTLIGQAAVLLYKLREVSSVLSPAHAVYTIVAKMRLKVQFYSKACQTTFKELSLLSGSRNFFMHIITVFY